MISFARSVFPELPCFELDCSDDAQEHIIRRAAVVQMKRARAQYAIQVIASKDLAAYKQLLVEGLTVDYVLDAQ